MTSCRNEGCQWWFKADTPQAKGDCVVKAIREALYLNPQKLK